MYSITFEEPAEQNPLITPENPTSNEFGNYRMSTNSNRSDWNCQAYYAFTDNTINHGWSSNNGTGYWIKWQYLDEPKEIIKYEVVTMYNNGQYGTTSWRLDGSNDDTNWVTVDERSNAGSYNVVEYTCNGTVGEYSYYRLISTSANTHTYFNKIKGYTIPKMVVKTSLGFNTITHRPLKFKVYELKDIGHLVMPIDGLVFYAPLIDNSATAVTGQALNYVGTLSYSEGCLTTPNQYNYVYASDSGMPTSNSDRTICCWAKMNGSHSAPYPFFGYGNPNGSTNFYMSISGDEKFGFDANSYGAKTSQSFQTSKWNFYALIVSSGSVRAFVNDYQETIETGSHFNTTLNGKLQIGRWCDHTDFYGSMSIKAVRIYDRALTQDEITLLSREFDYKR